MKNYLLLIFCALFIFSCNESCTSSSSSYGETSLYGSENATIFRETSDKLDKCSSVIAGEECFSDKSKDDVYQIISDDLAMNYLFSEKCYDESTEEEVACPDFVPKELSLESVAGCKTYEVDAAPNSKCNATQCPEVYFITNNDYFSNAVIDYMMHFDVGIGLSAVSNDGNFYLYISGEKGSYRAFFTWTESADDGTETEKRIMVPVNQKEPVETNDDDTDEIFTTETYNSAISECLADKIPTRSNNTYSDTEEHPFDGSYLEAELTGEQLSFKWYNMFNCADVKYFVNTAFDVDDPTILLAEWEIEEGAVLEWCNCPKILSFSVASSADMLRNIKILRIKEKGTEKVSDVPVNIHN